MTHQRSSGRQRPATAETRGHQPLRRVRQVVSALWLAVLVLPACRLVPAPPLARDARRPPAELCAWTARLYGIRTVPVAPEIVFVTPGEMRRSIAAASGREATPSAPGTSAEDELTWAAVLSRLSAGTPSSGALAGQSAWDDILGAQVAGTYDPVTREILVATGDPAHGEERLRSDELTALTVSHELVHAFDDARFGWGGWPGASTDDDGREALAALHEGIAVSVNLDQYLGPRLLESVDTPALASSLQEALARLWKRSVAGELDIADVEGVFGRPLRPGEREATSRFLSSALWRRGPLLFRYFMGTRFVLEARKRYGQGILGSLARDPPRSTAQILHPELYFDRRVEPLRLTPAVCPVRRPGWSVAYDGAMGELAVQLLLGARPDRAGGSRVSPSGGAGRDVEASWRGDRLTVWRHGEEELLSWRILTDSRSSAGQMAAALSARLAHDLRATSQGRTVWVRPAARDQEWPDLSADVLVRDRSLPGKRSEGDGLLATLCAPLWYCGHDEMSERTRVFGFLIDRHVWTEGSGDQGRSGGDSGGSLDLLAPAGLIGNGSWAGPLGGGWLFHRRVSGARCETDLLLHLAGWRLDHALAAGEIRLQPIARYRWGEAYGGLELGLGFILTAEERADGSGRVLVGRLFGRALAGWEWSASSVKLHVLFLVIEG